MVFTHGVGLDVQKKTVPACRVTPDPSGQPAEGLMELQDFGTMTADLLMLSDWLAAAGITQVAMESTGEDWRPGYHLLEGHVTIFLVNAAHVKQVPGRKTDKAAARWLAQLRRYGLLPASCSPPAGQRDRRDLTRYRTTLVPERRREVNRVQGVLERANMKLAAVATDIMGVSGRAIVAALLAGRAAPGTMAELATGRRRATIPLLEQALSGRRRDHHRRLLTLQLAHIAFLDEQIDALSAESTHGLEALEAEPPPPALTAPGGRTGQGGDAGDREASSPPRPFAQAIAVLDTIPGVAQRGAELLGAEWGPDLQRFGTASRLSAGTGVAPGNEESAGKRRSGTTRQGHRTLRTGLPQRAHAAARTQGTSLSALYQRLAARRGKTRAIMAVAHASVVSAFHMRARREPYHELGPPYFDEQRRDHLIDRVTRRIQRLGYRVHLEPVQAS